MLDAESIGLLPASERDAQGGPLLDEDEALLQQFERVQLVIGAAADQGEGTLFITEGRIIWLSAAQQDLGYSCDFPTIAMHAVATDAESSQRPCLYLQLDNGCDDGGAFGLGSGGSASSGNSASGSEDSEEEADDLLPELRLIPAEESQLEALFQAFCEGAERNPDTSDEEEGEGAGFFYNQDEALAGAAQGMALGGGGDVEELLGEDPSRFEDDEEEGEEAEEEQAATVEVQQQQAGSNASGHPNGC
ncbi:Chloride conductance regulatory protein ICln [Chlorella vulgaris]